MRGLYLKSDYVGVKTIVNYFEDSTPGNTKPFNFIGFFYYVNGDSKKAISSFLNCLREGCLEISKAIIMFEIASHDGLMNEVKQVIESTYPNGFSNLTLDTEYSHSEITIYLIFLVFCGKYDEAIDLDQNTPEELQTFTHKYYVGLLYTNLRDYHKADKYLRPCIRALKKNLGFADDYVYNLIALEEYNEAQKVSKYFERQFLNYSSAGERIRLMLQGQFGKSWEKANSRPIILNTTEVFPLEVPNENQEETVLVMTEWGLGDLWTYLTWFAELKKVFKKIIIYAPPKVCNLISNSFKEYEVYPIVLDRAMTVPAKFTFLRGKFSQEIMDRVSQVDRFYWDTSLNQIFRSTKASYMINRKDQYVYPDNKNIEKWRGRLQNLPKGRINIGISWTSSFSSPRRRMHYLKLESFMPIFNNPKYNVINLQYGNQSDEIDRVMEKHSVNNFYTWSDLDLSDNIDEVAALIHELDFVVAPCNFVMELAGSLGTECRYFITHHSGKFRSQLFENGRDLYWNSVKVIDCTHLKADEDIVKEVLLDIEQSKKW